jgi:hypothetical protein
MKGMKAKIIGREMFKSRKGMTMAFLVGMMITLIAFVLISGSLIRFMSKADDNSAELLCYNSMALRAQSAVKFETIGVDIEAKLVPSLCQNIVKKVSGNREQIMKEFADSMASCWWMFGEGRYEEILHDSDVNIIYDTAHLENMCFNCYTLLVDEDKIELGKNSEAEEKGYGSDESYISASEFNLFLLNENYSKANKSYIDYIQSYGGPGRTVMTAPAIFPNTAYSISFMPKNKEIGESDFWKGAAEVYVGGMMVVGAVVVGGAVTVCVLGTGGICGGGVATALSFLGSGTATAAATTTVGGVLLTSGAVAGAGVYTEAAGFNDMMSTMYGERDVSSIYLGFLETGEEMCGSEDIAGS